MNFYVGLHHPHHAAHFVRAMISVNALRGRVSGICPGGEWILDSGAFSQVASRGEFLMSAGEYACAIERWSGCGDLVAAVSQDYMVEDFVREKTRGTVADHQRWTIARYEALLDEAPPAYIMPVLQGATPDDYAAHARAYGSLLPEGAWVGVGSVCRRSSSPAEIEDILLQIKGHRPDLHLHLFGVKTTALASGLVRELAHSADSMAWSFAARKQGRDANDWREALRFARNIENMATQRPLPGFFAPQSSVGVGVETTDTLQ